MASQFLIRTVITCFLVAAMCAGASANTIFFDNFNDGNAEDGMPVTWVPWPQFPGDVDALSGDYVVSQQTDEAAVSGVPDVLLPDISIRSQVRLFPGVAGGGNVSLVARGDRAAVAGYLGGVDFEGDVFVGLGGSCCIEVVSTDLRVTEEDVVLQFDVFGDSLELRAWRPGEPMPTEPQISVTDDTLMTGEPALIVDGPAPGSAVFRFVHVADAHIPEPSTAVFLVLSVACLIASRSPRLFRF